MTKTMDSFLDGHTYAMTQNNMPGFDDELMTPVIGEYFSFLILFLNQFALRICREKCAFYIVLLLNKSYRHRHYSH